MCFMKNPQKIKIQKLIADSGFCSRRAAELLISEGRVYVNGKKAGIGDRYTYVDKIRIDNDSINLKNRFHQSSERQVFLMNKQLGEVCSKKDEKGRKSVFDRLPKIKSGRWIMVGRLDINTTGLLIFTNDGEYANYLMHPKNNIKRVYRVKIQGILTLQHIQNLKNGVLLFDGVSRFDTVEQIKKTDKNSVIEVSTTSGKNRIVRRLLESQGKTVLRLKRTIYGPFVLD